jgi:ABC-type nickel/cobalt efflux system permease component RcnA
MIPCPSALVVLLIAVNLHRVGFGLLLIGAFSVGLALVLILIGVLAVTAARHVRRLAGEASWVKRLPALSAGVIMLVGLAMVANALAQAGMLRL